MTVEETIRALKCDGFEGKRVRMWTPAGMRTAVLFVSAYENRDGVLIEGPLDVDVYEELEARRQDLTTEEFCRSLVESGFSWMNLEDFIDGSVFDSVESKLKEMGLIDQIPAKDGGMVVEELIKRLEKQDGDQPVFISQHGAGLAAVVKNPGEDYVTLVVEP